MELLLDFVKTYLSGLLHLWPFIMLMVVAIAAIGFQVGKIERWTLSNAMYFAFVTATTVGYGDMRPTTQRTKWLAILIALLGVLLTGLIVAIGLEAVSYAFREAHGVTAPISP